jgi:hypothetical protein
VTLVASFKLLHAVAGPNGKSAGAVDPNATNGLPHTSCILLGNIRHIGFQDNEQKNARESEALRAFDILSHPLSNGLTQSPNRSETRRLS